MIMIDYIVIHSGTNDVWKLTANEIRTNIENCLVNLKHSNKFKPNFFSFEVIRRLNPRTYTQNHTLTVVQWGGGGGGVVDGSSPYFDFTFSAKPLTFSTR